MPVRLGLVAHGGDGRYEMILARPDEIAAPFLEEGDKAIPPRAGNGSEAEIDCPQDGPEAVR